MIGALVAPSARAGWRHAARRDAEEGGGERTQVSEVAPTAAALRARGAVDSAAAAGLLPRHAVPTGGPRARVGDRCRARGGGGRVTAGRGALQGGGGHGWTRDRARRGGCEY